MNKTKLFTILGSASLTLLAGVLFAFANWSAAPGTPPYGNTPEPINVGASAQTKEGPLTIKGIIETTAGGIKFPDGTIQTTAATAGTTTAGYTPGTASYTIPGTYSFIVPTGVTKLAVEGWGAGGGGAAGQYTNGSEEPYYDAGGYWTGDIYQLRTSVTGGGGGGSGAYIKTDIAVAPGDDISITIGAGGRGGSLIADQTIAANYGATGDSIRIAQYTGPSNNTLKGYLFVHGGSGGASSDYTANVGTDLYARKCNGTKAAGGVAAYLTNGLTQNVIASSGGASGTGCVGQSGGNSTDPFSLHGVDGIAGGAGVVGDFSRSFGGGGNGRFYGTRSEYHTLTDGTDTYNSTGGEGYTLVKAANQPPYGEVGKPGAVIISW